MANGSPDSQLRRAVFLDRDGVINRTIVRKGTPHPPDSLDELEILDGVPEALSKLAAAGLELIVVTNQPDVARGTQTRERIEEMNAALMRHLPLRDVLVCYHDNADRCACRKPLPGMIHEAAAKHGISAAESFMVGDRWSDVVAGAAAGCRTFLIDEPYSHREKCAPDYIVTGLPQAADIILRLIDPERKERA